MNTQKGFTLIELIMVIVILGILSAFAIPKYIDIKNDAAQAAVNGVAGALAAAAATNFASRTVKADALHGVAVANCTDTPSLLQGGALPTGSTNIGGAYSVASLATTAAGVSCVLTFTPTTGTPVTANFIAVTTP